MVNKSIFSTISVALAVLSVTAVVCNPSASAQTNSANYTFVVASGFLCDAEDSRGCPAVARSANGDSYEISGAGTFDSEDKSVRAAGTFNHKTTNGNVLETGVWIGSDLISFDSYGIAPAALMQKGRAFGPPQIGPKRLPIRSGPLPTGGLAVFRIRLLPTSGATRIAVLQMNCALGNVPREHSVEGIRLTLERNGADFSEEAGGRVMFLSTRPEGTVPSKTSKQEPALESRERERN
jgi:hypothetical protein